VGPDFLFAVLLLSQQTPGALLKDIPALQKPITIEKTILSLPQAASELRDLTGIPLKLPDSVLDDKVCILVKDMPAHRLITHLATLFDLVPNFDGTKIWMDETPGISSERFRYLQLENKALYARAFRRLWAVAEASKNAIGTRTEDEYDQDALDSDDALLKTWADDQAARADFRAVGVFTNIQPLPRLTLAPFGADFEAMRYFGDSYNPQFLMGGDKPFTYRLAKPTTQFRSLPEIDSKFANTGIELWYEPNSGIFETAVVEGDKSNPWERDPPLIRYPKPTGTLKDSNFGRRLLAWERPKAPTASWASAPVDTRKSPNAPQYSTPGVMTVDQLSWIHQTTGAQIVSDSFRIPSTRPRFSGRLGTTAAEVIGNLAKADSMFIRYEPDAALLRHGGFWRLKLSEPPEGLVADLDAIDEQRDITYDEFIDAVKNMPRACMARFIKPNRFLANFDIAPLQTGYFGLLGLSILTGNERRELWSGIPTEWTDLPEQSVPDSVAPIFNSITGTIRPDSASDLPEIAVLMAALTGGSTIGRFSEYLEPRIKPVTYLKSIGLWGAYWANFKDSRPSSMQKKDFEDKHWRYISVIPPTEGNKHLGIFYSVTPYDGVIYWLRRRDRP